jgi:hypothetical protein
MATYKVIQDIEAEDKLLGWMTPRQAIYAAIVVVSGLLCFMLVTKGAWWLAVPMLPHMILFSVLSGPFVHDQPSEIWLLARIQFFLKPRKRIWDQSGLKELVTVTAPKKIERVLTDGLSQTEVKSRLRALADTIDSRGWAIKNINVNLYTQPGYAMNNSDRLIDTSTLPREVPNYDITAQDDILDERTNPAALQLQQMINQSAQSHRQQVIAQMQQTPTQQPTVQPATYWFADPGSPIAPSSANPPLSKQDEEALLKKLHDEQNAEDVTVSHLKTIEPLSAEHKSHKKQTKKKAPEPARTPFSPATLELANNDDLNVSTIARQAQKANQSELGDNEVVISLH